jgi:hypothetical protein
LLFPQNFSDDRTLLVFDVVSGFRFFRCRWFAVGDFDGKFAGSEEELKGQEEVDGDVDDDVEDETSRHAARQV